MLYYLFIVAWKRRKGIPTQKMNKTDSLSFAFVFLREKRFVFPFPCSFLVRNLKFKGETFEFYFEGINYSGFRDNKLLKIELICEILESNL